VSEPPNPELDLIEDQHRCAGLPTERSDWPPGFTTTCPACGEESIVAVKSDGGIRRWCPNDCDAESVMFWLGRLQEQERELNGGEPTERAPEEVAEIGESAARRLAALDLLIDMSAVADAPPDYVIEPLAAKGYLTVLPGKRGSYKSMLTMLAGACCHGGGGELAGLRCAPAVTLNVDAENGPRLLRRRFTLAGIRPDGMLVADGTKIQLPRKLGLLRELIVATGAELVILDSLRRLTPGLDEDSSRDMAPVIADLANLARETNAALVLLHHQSSKPNAPPSRGSSAIEDQADVVMRLKRYLGRRIKLWVGDGGKFRIDDEPDPVWLDFQIVGGLLTLGETEPIKDADEEPEPTAQDRLVGQIRLLAPQVRADLDGGGWAPSRVAAAVGSKQDNRSFRAALKQLTEAGEWVAHGATRDRRVRPSDSGLRAHPLGEGTNGPNKSEHLFPGEEGQT
jgi:AAA domain